MSDELLLAASGLTKRYGEFVAVRNVSLGVHRGEIHCVIGPNGAGKSTLFGLISGEIRPTSGTVTFAGTDIGRLPAWRRTRAGIGRSFQVARVFNSFTVRENVRAAVLAERRRLWRFWRSEDKTDCEEQASRILEEIDMDQLSYDQADQLSQGDRKRLEVGMVLAGSPKLFMFDEPTAGMSTAETRDTIRLIRSLRDSRGCSVLLTEHDMSVVFELSDRVTVLHHGEVLVSGEPATVRGSAEVRAVYLGEDG